MEVINNHREKYRNKGSECEEMKMIQEEFHEFGGR